MKKYSVSFFKPSGKWYTDEDIEIPQGMFVWEARDVIKKHLAGRLVGMTAVLLDGPWGYPAMWHTL